MVQGLRFKVADIVFSLESDAADCFEDRWGIYENFRVTESPDIVLRVHCGVLPSMIPSRKAFVSGPAWDLCSFSHGWIVSVPPGETENPDCVSIFDHTFTAGDIYVHPRDGQHSSFNSSYPFGQLMLLMINLLNKRRGALFHACAVKEGNRGFLFAGVSGAGKTTTAKLWQHCSNAMVLSDDRIAVRLREDGRFWLFGTPWHGEAKAASPEAVPVEKVFVLNHASLNQAERMTPVSAVSQLLRCVSPAFWDDEGVAFTVEFLSALVREIPVYRLGFVPDGSAVEYVRRLP